MLDGQARAANIVVSEDVGDIYNMLHLAIESRELSARAVDVINNPKTKLYWVSPSKVAHWAMTKGCFRVHPDSWISKLAAKEKGDGLEPELLQPGDEQTSPPPSTSKVVSDDVEDQTPFCIALGPKGEGEISKNEYLERSEKRASYDLFLDLVKPFKEKGKERYSIGGLDPDGKPEFFDLPPRWARALARTAKAYPGRATDRYLNLEVGHPTPLFRKLQARIKGHLGIKVVEYQTHDGTFSSCFVPPRSGRFLFLLPLQKR